jgi:hypothetical protein
MEQCRAVLADILFNLATFGPICFAFSDDLEKELNSHIDSFPLPLLREPFLTMLSEKVILMSLLSFL